MSLVFYFIPWKHQKTSGFPMFSGRYRKRLVAWKGPIKTLYYYILNHHSSLMFFYKVACTSCYSPAKNHRFKVNNKNTRGHYGFYHIETDPLICRVNQWTSFYMVGISITSLIICPNTVRQRNEDPVHKKTPVLESFLIRLLSSGLQFY